MSVASPLPSPTTSSFISAAYLTPFGILSAKAAACHLGTLRAICQDQKWRSREAHLRHVATCLAFTDDPTGVKVVVEICGHDADALAVAFMAINRSKTMRDALPRLFNRPEAALTISRFGDRISEQLKPRWQDFLKPRKCLF